MTHTIDVELTDEVYEMLDTLAGDDALPGEIATGLLGEVAWLWGQAPLPALGDPALPVAIPLSREHLEFIDLIASHLRAGRQQAVQLLLLAGLGQIVHTRSLAAKVGLTQKKIDLVFGVLPADLTVEDFLDVPKAPPDLGDEPGDGEGV